ncbi:MAG: RluA family pseudouridine synthase [Clostridia bacterium]|nr:RluA family pseudouridine synthase [Clostridia bacterium]
MKQFTVGKNDAGQRLDKFITKAVPALPQSLMYKEIRRKYIKINGMRAQISDKLAEGDVVTLYVKDEFFVPVRERFDFLTASKKLDIVYEDENLMLLNKSVGVLSHPDNNEYNDTLISRVQRYLYEKGEYDPRDENSFTPALVNRIDRNTGGIVIAAKNAESLRILNQKLKNREIHKYYLCVVHGILKKKSGVLEAWMIKDENKNKAEVFDSEVPGGKLMKTKYSVVAEKNDLSLVEVELLTGRTHQIRAQFAHIGHPLLGDGKYGTNALNKKYGYKKQFLYSQKLKFDFESEAGILEYLDGREFETEEVWFKKEFLSGELFVK